MNPGGVNSSPKLSAISQEELTDRALRLKAFVFDVDGVLTDGTLWISQEGELAKGFSVHDGLALSWLKKTGWRLGIVTGRESSIVMNRANELKFDRVIQGQLNKAEGLSALANDWGLTLDQVGYIGDDWPDLSALIMCGFAATVQEAPIQIRSQCHWVASRPAGKGAVRELVELLFNLRGEWQLIEQAYSTTKTQASGASISAAKQ